MCDKVCYPTRSAAKRKLKELNKAHGTNLLTNTYLCPRCNFYHITSMNKHRSRKTSEFRRRVAEKIQAQKDKKLQRNK